MTEILNWEITTAQNVNTVPDSYFVPHMTRDSLFQNYFTTKFPFFFIDGCSMIKFTNASRIFTKCT